MSKNKTNAAVAEKAVAKSQKKTATERTPDDIFKGIRQNLTARLAVTPEDTRFLLAAYDIAFKSAVDLGVKVEELTKQVALLTEKNEEFRRVYEIENAAFSAIIHKDDVEVPAELAVSVVAEE
jgi:hypothetical protein